MQDCYLPEGNASRHKQDKIKRLNRHFFLKLKFILIGTSGREILKYTKALHEFPDRILAVYIRKCGKKDDFDKNTQEFEDEGVRHYVTVERIQC